MNWTLINTLLTALIGLCTALQAVQWMRANRASAAAADQVRAARKLTDAAEARLADLKGRELRAQFMVVALRNELEAKEASTIAAIRAGDQTAMLDLAGIVHALGCMTNLAVQFNVDTRWEQ